MTELERINNLTREEMCRMWRYHPPGTSPFIRGTPEWEAFNKRFEELGGFSPQISKKIGEES